MKCYNQNKKNHVNIRATWYLIFAAFLKIKKFLYLNFKEKVSDFHHWHLTKNFVQMMINKTIILFSINKTNSLWTNIILIMTKINDEICSIIVIKNLMCLFSVLPNKTIFQNKCESFDRKMINSALNKTMIHSEYLKNEYDYSLHKNAKRSAKTIGLTKIKMQILKWWNSTIYKMYVNRNFFQFFDMFKQFQKTCSKII